MKFLIPALSFEQQADQLLKRGLQADRARLIKTLRQVNYYRLSAYWHPFRQSDESFIAGTTLEMIWRRYRFDRQLRLLVMDAIERVEVCVLRTQMVEYHALKYGPFGYRERKNFRPDFSNDNFQWMLKDIDQSAKRSREVFVKDYFAKYTSEPGLPLWMAAEVASFGNLFTFFRHIHYQEQKFLAAQLAISAKVLENWLMCLNYVRNLCAHHSRLWNLELAIKPIVPDNDPDWLSPVPLDNRWTYAALTVLRWLLRKIAPDSLWKDRLKELLLEYPDIPVSHAGFPDAWETSPIWK